MTYLPEQSVRAVLASRADAQGAATLTVRLDPDDRAWRPSGLPALDIHGPVVITYTRYREGEIGVRELPASSVMGVLMLELDAAILR